MKSKALTILAMLLITSLLAASCSFFARAGSDLMAGVEAAEWPEDPEAVSPDYIRAMGTFSLNLANALGQKDGNMLVSPASVFLALAMTLNGADGQTRTDMITALAATGLSADDLNRGSRDWAIRLGQTDGKSRIGIANSIWYREGFAADPDFLQKNADFFAAAARSLDFSDSASPDMINDWVSRQTNGKIEKIIDTIEGNTVMFLINAIYFNARWLTTFDANNTYDGTFQAADGGRTAKFMKRTGEMDYLSVEGAQGVLLPYSDGRFAMAALLPDESKTPREILAALTADKITAMLDSRESKEITLSFPKFTAEFSAELENVLTGLGMGIAFSSDADFSLMQTGREKNLFIRRVTHKTFIRVDELGTEAAAATKVEIALKGLPLSEMTLRFDRPFLYSILDLNTGLPLFIGICETP